MSSIEQVTVEIGEPDKAIVWLHGLGADGYDFVPLVRELEQLGLQNTRFVFPHAPKIPVSINGGYVMRAWYDIKNVDLKRLEDAEGIQKSSKLALDLIQRQIKAGIEPDRIVLAGFSQGGAITYHAGLRCPSRLAGLVALSTYMPLSETLDQEASAANSDTPIFTAHGRRDGIVSIERGKQAVDELNSRGYQTEMHVYDMEHAVCGEEVRDLAIFLNSLF